MKKVVKMCINWKALLCLGAIILLAYIFLPSLASYSWILFALLCPLSMMFMMAGMNHKHDEPEKVFVCPECGMSYKEADWAKKCATWCKEHKSCNLEIIRHAVNKN